MKYMKQTKREEAIKRIREKLPKLTTAPLHEIQETTPNASVPETVRQLKAQGYKCSYELVSDLMDEAGYVTNVYSPTGIAEFWHQNEVSKKIVTITAKQK